MRTIFVFIIASLLFTGSALAELNIDISGSTIERLGPTAMRIRNVTVPGSQEKFWADLTWDKNRMVFVPTNAGIEESQQSVTWTFVVEEFSRSFEYTLTSYPTDRSFVVSYRTISGSPFICNGEDFTQGNNQFSLYTFHFGNNALITYTTAFSGCGYIYPGQTLQAEITNVPSWFNFSQPFMVAFGPDDVWTLTP